MAWGVLRETDGREGDREWRWMGERGRGKRGVMEIKGEREGGGGEERVEGARERHTHRGRDTRKQTLAETVISIKHRNTTERPTDTGEQRQTDRPCTDAFETAYIH